MANVLLFGLIFGFLLGMIFIESNTDADADALAFTEMEKQYPILSTKPAFQFGKSLNSIKTKLFKTKKKR